MKQKSILIILLASILICIDACAQSNKGFDYYYNAGKHLLSLNDSANQAKLMFDSAINLNPWNADLYIGRGLAKIKDGKPIAGMKDYDTAISFTNDKDKLWYYELKEEQLTGKKGVPHVVRVETYGGGGLEGSYGDRIHFGPQINSYPDVKGLFRFFSYDKINKVYDEAVKLFPDSEDVYRDRADFYLKNGIFKRAIEDVNKLISLNPKPEYYFLHACLIYNSDDHSRANKEVKKILNDCIARNPNDWNSYNCRAMLFTMDNLPEKAIESYTKAIELFPNETSYINRAGEKRKQKTYNEQDIQSDLDNAAKLNKE